MRNAVTRISIAVAASLLMTEAMAQAVHRFDVAAQPLGKALNALATQAGLNLYFDPADVEGKRAPGVKVETTAEEALTTLLAGTELEATYVDEKTVRVSRKSEKTALHSERQQGIRFAQADAANPDTAAQAEEAAEERSKPASAHSGADSALETVTIVGSSIRSNEDPIAGVRPIQTITAKELNQGSGDHVGDFLRKLPINTGFVESPMTDEYGGGDSNINLRGIGSQYSLALIDGRRFNGESIPADVGVLPSVAVEGMDILTGGASAIYGSEAVAGVLNIRLRRHVEGAEFHASYGDTSRRDAQTSRVSTLFGVKDDRFSFTGSFEYQNRRGFTRGDRKLTRSRDFRPYGGVDLRSCCIGMPHIIYLSSDDGATPLSIDVSRFQPGHYSGDPSDYMPYDADAPAFTTSDSSTYPPQNQVAGHWYADYQLIDDRLVFFTEGYANRRQQEYRATYYRPTLTVPATNPYNPFGEEVTVTYLVEDLPRLLYKLDTVAYMAVGGVQGTLGDYHYEVSLSQHRRRRNTTGYNDIDTDALEAAVNRTDELAFNPFGYYANTPEQLALIAPATESGYKDIQKNWIATAKVDGKLFDWYAGTAKFALGYEHREVGYNFNPRWGSRTINYWFDGGGYVSEKRHRKVDAGSAELRLPLYQASDAATVFHSAEVTGAVRHEKYNDFGSSTVSQFAGKVGLLRDSIILRASYAQSFLAPTLSDLTTETYTYTNQNAFFDPYFNAVVPITVIAGGNPDLGPEKGKSVNFGIVYRPLGLPNATLTLDYWQLKLSNIIDYPVIDAILQGTSLSGSLTRDPVTHLPTVDTRVANGGTRKIDGVDFEARYHWDTGVGAFNVSLGGMYFTRFEGQGNDGSVVDYLGRYSPELTAMPKLRTTLGADWAYGGLDANIVMHWMSGYQDDFSGVEHHVGSYNTVDTQVGYAFQQEGFLKNTRIYAGLENVFDTPLHFVMGSGDGWDRSLSDLRGRYYYFGMSKKFQ